MPMINSTLPGHVNDSDNSFVKIGARTQESMSAMYIASQGPSKDKIADLASLLFLFFFSTTERVGGS